MHRLFVALCLTAVIVAPSGSANANVVRSRPNPNPVQCPNVRGGALAKSVVRGISCTFAQQIWNHFSWIRGGKRPALPSGWRCLSFLMTVRYPLSEVDCNSGNWDTWARFTET
jgi:hypothetical protein